MLCLHCLVRVTYDTRRSTRCFLHRHKDLVEACSDLCERSPFLSHLKHLNHNTRHQMKHTHAESAILKPFHSTQGFPYHNNRDVKVVKKIEDAHATRRAGRPAKRIPDSTNSSRFPQCTVLPDIRTSKQSRQYNTIHYITKSDALW